MQQAFLPYKELQLMNCTCITADCGLHVATGPRATAHKHLTQPPAALNGHSYIYNNTSKKLNRTSAFAFSMAIPTYTSRPKILIPEKVSPDGLALLKGSFDVDQKQGLGAEELKDIIGEYEALIVRSETKVTAELLSAAKKLKVVARAGVGVDNVDVKTATSLGIIVVNSPSGNINAAAEHTIACKYLGCLVTCCLDGAALLWYTGSGHNEVAFHLLFHSCLKIAE